MSTTKRMSYAYFENLDVESKKRYREKLSVANLTECPYKLPAGLWINDPTKWPEIEYGDIYDYLINTPGMKIRLQYTNSNMMYNLMNHVTFNLLSTFDIL